MKHQTETREETNMTIYTYYAWAENAKGQIEEIRVERAGGQPARGFAPNPHKKQEWTGRIFKSVKEAATVTGASNARIVRQDA